MTLHGARHLRVDPEYAGQRVDNFLIRELGKLPKTRIYRMIRSGEVRLDGKRVQAAHRLAGGEDLRIPPLRSGTVSAGLLQGHPDTAENNSPLVVHPTVPVRGTTAPPCIPVVHEDAHWLVVDKPAGLAVHGGSGVHRGVIEWLRQLRPDLRYLELAHRLDRETSGVLVLAKRRAALLALHRDLRERRVAKTYRAVVAGRVGGREVVVRAPLQRELGAQGERIVRVDPEGREALSRIRALAGGEDPLSGLHYSLVEVRIETGRTHQIRVHLSHIGHPILGDDRYGDFPLNRRLHAAGLRRMLLHAAELRLPQASVEGGRLVLRAPMPHAFAAWTGS